LVHPDEDNDNPGLGPQLRQSLTCQLGISSQRGKV
jgi:hypothetical protein